MQCTGNILNKKLAHECC